MCKWLKFPPTSKLTRLILCPVFFFPDKVLWLWNVKTPYIILTMKIYSIYALFNWFEEIDIIKMKMRISLKKQRSLIWEVCDLRRLRSAVIDYWKRIRKEASTNQSCIHGCRGYMVFQTNKFPLVKDSRWHQLSSQDGTRYPILKN